MTAEESETERRLGSQDPGSRKARKKRVIDRVKGQKEIPSRLEVGLR